jgi:hypothetical protein
LAPENGCPQGGVLQTMFPSKIKCLTTIVLISIIFGSIGVLGYFRSRANQTDKMFPNGLVHDFGTVMRGIQYNHSFRVVNTSDFPLHILSLRCS